MKILSKSAALPVSAKLARRRKRAPIGGAVEPPLPPGWVAGCTQAFWETSTVKRRTAGWLWRTFTRRFAPGRTR